MHWNKRLKTVLANTYSPAGRHVYNAQKQCLKDTKKYLYSMQSLPPHPPSLQSNTNKSLSRSIHPSSHRLSLLLFVSLACSITRSALSLTHLICSFEASMFTVQTVHLICCPSTTQAHTSVDPSVCPAAQSVSSGSLRFLYSFAARGPWRKSFLSRWNIELSQFPMFIPGV